MDLQRETLWAVSVLSPCNNPNPGFIFMEEIWENIRDYGGDYQISNYGRVRSVDRIKPYYSHNGKRNTTVFYKGRLLKPYKDKYYWTVKIIRNGKYKTHLIHRLVAKAFIPNPENKRCINHIDFDTTNNLPNNLEWCTHGENIWHTVKHNRNNPTIGEAHPCAKLKELDVLRIRGMVKSGIPKRRLARIYNVSNTTIIGICNGRLWKHI